MNLNDALEGFLLTLDAEGRSPYTVKAYREHMRPMFRWLSEQETKALGDLTPFILRRYFADYRRSHAPDSVRTVYATLRAFLNWCVTEGLLTASPLSGVRPPMTPQPSKKVYRQGELTALLKALAADKTPLGLRDNALVCILLDTGSRASEVCALSLDDIQADALLLRRTKSGRPRMAFLGKRSQQALARY